MNIGIEACCCELEKEYSSLSEGDKAELSAHFQFQIDAQREELEGLKMKELKPCPFCGGEAVAPSEMYHHVSCSKCGATGANWAEYDSAIEAWNTRHEQTCTIDNTGYATGLCSSCGTEIVASVVNNTPPDYVEGAHYCPACGAKVVSTEK